MSAELREGRLSLRTSSLQGVNNTKIIGRTRPIVTGPS
jgi:hypothetical protein